MPTSHPLVLLAEDNPDHVELARLAFAHCSRRIELHVVPDGQACMARLEKRGEFAQARTPHLLLLDLDMPRMGGLEVLERLAAHEQAELRSLPVVILTTSTNQADIERAWARRCHSYVVKPSEFSDFVNVVQCLADYWFGAVTLPRP